jgi:hypothetical protein
MPGCLLHHPLYAKGCQIVAQSHAMPKAVQSTNWDPPLKVKPIKNFNCHICVQHPKFSKDLLL